MAGGQASFSATPGKMEPVPVTVNGELLIVVAEFSLQPFRGLDLVPGDAAEGVQHDVDQDEGCTARMMYISWLTGTAVAGASWSSGWPGPTESA